MNKVHIIMPMAGEGSRFKEKGYTVPKPLIELGDHKLYQHALRSLEGLKKQNKELEFTYTFIVRDEFYDEVSLEILKSYPKANIYSVNKTTKGALETVMLVEDYILDDEYVISIDCDLEFKSEEFIYQLTDAIEAEVPLLLSFYSRDPKYSYVSVNEYGEGCMVREKETISTHAIGGCYCLGPGKLFKKCAKMYIYDFYKGKISSPEIYMSLIYNYIIKEICDTVAVYDMNFHEDHYWSYGTPDDLIYYNYNRNIWDK